MSNVDPPGLVLHIVGSNVLTQQQLQNAYSSLAQTPLGLSMIQQLEDSPTEYVITDMLSSFYGANFVPQLNIFSIDPNLNPPTIVQSACGTDQYELSPTNIILGHEFGHALTPQSTNPFDIDQTNQYEQTIVDMYEQPLRQQLHLPPRGPYAGPSIN